MSTSSKDNLRLLKILELCSPKLRQVLLQKADKKTVKCLVECVHNILHNSNIKLEKNIRKKLQKFKDPLRKIIDRKLSLKKRKQIICQRGGGIIPLILPPLLSLLASIV
jgi:hypothetical protein